MSFSDFSERSSFIHSLDPRIRICVFLFFAVLVCFSLSKVLLVLMLVMSLAALRMSCIRIAEIRGRLLSLNIFVLLIYISNISSEILASRFPDVILFQSNARLPADFHILTFLRTNTILLIATALINTMDAVTLGHALAHLKVPGKLAHLMLFTVRYIELIHKEYLQMKDAMRARAFRAGLNGRTYKALSNLVAMLLVRSLDHAERMTWAMKCRCFTGHFYMLDHFKVQRRDIKFAVCSGLVWVMIFGAEVACRTL